MSIPSPRHFPIAKAFFTRLKESLPILKTKFDSKQLKALDPLLPLNDRFKHLSQELVSLLSLPTDPDPEWNTLVQSDVDALDSSLFLLLISTCSVVFPSPTTNKAILELRPGVGGSESVLFCKDLWRMFDKGLSLQSFKVKQTEVTEKGVIGTVQGNGVWEWIRFEAGVHRVQRIPDTEVNGRMHTSTVTVAVLPELIQNKVTIKQSELRIDTYRASGKGGQHVNVTDSAVRITHLPTGVSVTNQNERSQHQNKAKAMEVLEMRLQTLESRKVADAYAKSRANQIKSADRSDKIRTYNYKSGRVVDHRYGIHANVAYLMNGEHFASFIEQLREKDFQQQSEALETFNFETFLSSFNDQ